MWLGSSQLQQNFIFLICALTIYAFLKLGLKKYIYIFIYFKEMKNIVCGIPIFFMIFSFSFLPLPFSSRGNCYKYMGQLLQTRLKEKSSFKWIVLIIIIFAWVKYFSSGGGGRVFPFILQGVLAFLSHSIKKEI